MAKGKEATYPKCSSSCNSAVKIKDDFYCRLKTMDIKFPTESGKLTFKECMYYRKGLR